MSARTAGQPIIATRLAITVTVAILAAAAIIYGIYAASRPSDFDCAAQRADVALGNLEPYELDDACR